MRKGCEYVIRGSMSCGVICGKPVVAKLIDNEGTVWVSYCDEHSHFLLGKKQGLETLQWEVCGKL